MVNQIRSSKSIVVFLVIVAALITMTVVQVDYALFNDQTAQGEAATRAQLAALVPAVHSEFRALSENTKTVLSGLVDKGGDFNDSVSTKAEMVARIRPNETGEWTLIGKVFHEKTNVRAWAESYSVIALKSIKPKDISQSGAALVSLLDPQRNPFFLWIIREDDQRWAAVITKPALFQSLMDRQKGQLSTVYLVNRQGQVLGHTTPEYVGTLISEEPITAEIISIGKRAGSKLFKDKSGSTIHGFYEQVPYTNIFVALARPLKAAEKSRESLRLQMILLGVGLMMVGVAAMVLVSRAENRGRSMAGGSGVTVNPQVPEPGPLTPQTSSTTPASGLSLDQKTEIMKERMKAYTASASALARELNGPLVKILSQAQMIKSRLKEDTPEAQRIEVLAREGRQIIQKLLTFSGEEDFRIEPTSINESLTRALNLFESKFQAKGIKLEKNLKRMPQVSANHLGIVKILEAVFNNAIEAMERSPNKVLKIDLEESAGDVKLRISDSGDGISLDQQAKVFDPFFTTKSASAHSGLGLSMAMGIVNEFGGKIDFKSTPGSGTQVEITFSAGPGEVPVKTIEALAPPIAGPPTGSAQAQPQSGSPLAQRPTLSPLLPPLRSGLPPSPFSGERSDGGASVNGTVAPKAPKKEAPGLLQSRSLEATMAAIDDTPDDPDEFSYDDEPITGTGSALLPQEPSRPPAESLRVKQAQLMEKLQDEIENTVLIPVVEDRVEKTVEDNPIGKTTVMKVQPPPVKPAALAKIDVPKFSFPKPGDKK